MSTSIAGFVAAARLGDLPPGTMRRIVVRDAPVVLVNAGRTLHALADECLCTGESLADGELAGMTIRCTLSGWRYDIVTGAVAGVPSLCLDVHDVRLVDDCIVVALEPRTPGLA